MDISFGASLSGLKASFTRQAVSANDIANVNTPGYQQVDVYQTDVQPGGTRVSRLARTPNPSPDLSGTDLAKEMVEQKLSKNDEMANLRVIKMKDKMVQETLDLLA
jgi:flagellar basal-body rod protein FlgC